MTKIERVLKELNELYDFYRKLRRQRQPDLEQRERSRGQRTERGVSTAVAEKLSALMTRDYLEARAARGSRASFDAALGEIPDAPARDDDTL